MANGWRSRPIGMVSRNCSRSQSPAGRRCLLVKEYSIDPTWSPSGQFLVYSGADVGTTFSVKAVSADGDASSAAEPDSDQGRQAPGLSRRGRCTGHPERRRLTQGVLARRSQDRSRAATDQSRSRVCHRRFRRICGRSRNHLRSGTRRVGYCRVRPARSMKRSSRSGGVDAACHAFQFFIRAAAEGD